MAGSGAVYVWKKSVQNWRPHPEIGDRQFTEEIGAGVSEFLKDPFFQQFAVNGHDTGASRCLGRPFPGFAVDLNRMGPDVETGNTVQDFDILIPQIADLAQTHAGIKSNAHNAPIGAFGENTSQPF